MASHTDRPQTPHRRLRIALIAIAASIAASIAFAAWLIGSENGARAVLSVLAGNAAGALKIDAVQGCLAGPLRIGSLAIERPNQRVVLDDLRLDWQPSALLHGTLHVTSLQASKISITSKIEQQPEPARLPDSIALPLSLQLDQVQVDGGEIRWGPVNVVKLGAFGFDLDFDRQRYRLRLRQLAARSTSAAGPLTGNFSGQATLAAAKPYALHASFASGGSATIDKQTIGANGRIDIDGSLAQLAANIDLAIGQARLRGGAVLQPFSERVLTRTNLNAQALDLAAFGRGMPRTSIDASLTLSAGGAGQLALLNKAAGRIDEDKVPLTELHAAIAQGGGQLTLNRLAATLGSNRQTAGTVTGNARYGAGALTLALTVDALDLRGFDRRLQATRLAGTVEMRHAAGKQQFALNLTEPVGKQHLALAADATLADTRLTLQRAELRLGGGRVDASAQIELAGRQSFHAEGKVNRFKLHDLGKFAQFPALDLTGEFSLRGARQPGLDADLAFQINDSRLGGRPLQGEGQAQLRADRILVPKLLLAAGDNRLDVHGELSQRKAQLSFAIAAPKLEQLGAGFAGALDAGGTAGGSFAQPRIDIKWNGSNLRSPGQFQIENTQGQADVTLNRNRPLFIHAATADASIRGLKTAAQQLAALSAHVQFAPQPNAPLALALRVEGMTTPQWRAERFDVTAQGTTAQHTLNATVIESGSQNWQVTANGGLRELERAVRWQGSIDRFDAAGNFVAHLAAPAALSISRQRVQLDRFRLDADSGTIAVEQFVRDPRGMATRGRIDRLQVAQLLKFAGPQPALSTDLQLGGEWDVTIADSINGSVKIRRLGGDVVLHSGTRVALGLRALDASATAVDGRLALQLNADGAQLGHIEAAAKTGATRVERRFEMASDAPISGTAKIDIPSLAWAGPLISPTVISEGRLQSEIAVGGTLAQPTFAGHIAGSGLRVLLGDYGLDLRQGVLESEFQGDTLVVKNLAFQSGEGHVAASGPIGFSEGAANAQIALKAQRFTLLNRSDRKLVVSGLGQIGWHEGRAKASGAFKADSGYFDIGREDMPQLSEDVVVAGRNKKAPGPMVAAVDLDVDFGNNVAIKGRGLDALLAGRIRLTSEPKEPLRAQGTVQIVQGTYTAYSRKLAIEQGVLRFNGPLQNPALDILAMRRDQEVEAGVAVRGTVLAPRVTLVSEPPVPEAEKLSWLVLGRPLDTAGNADLGALQSAAGALLSESAAAGVQSQIATAFGLDDFRIGSNQNNLQQHIITLGKRLSSRLYVSYEQSLQTATSVVLLRYTLSPRLTVETEAGTRSAVSLFYNVAFD